MVKTAIFSDFSNFYSIWARPHVCKFLIFNFKTQIDLKAEREFETNLAFILDFTSPEITANKVKQVLQFT